LALRRIERQTTPLEASSPEFIRSNRLAFRAEKSSANVASARHPQAIARKCVELHETGAITNAQRALAKNWSLVAAIVRTASLQSLKTEFRGPAGSIG
jgi:hypothetical protein